MKLTVIREGRFRAERDERDAAWRLYYTPPGRRSQCIMMFARRETLVALQAVVASMVRCGGSQEAVRP